MLEHVVSPEMVVKELYRVLNKDGWVYSETPFLQAVHEGAYDFTRYTKSGHRWLFRSFEEIDSGSLYGAFTSTLYIASYALSGLVRNKLIGIITRMLFMRIASMIDSLVKKKTNEDVSCCNYFIGKKSFKGSQAKDDWIIEYYNNP